MLGDRQLLNVSSHDSGQNRNVGALLVIIRIGFWAYSRSIITLNPNLTVAREHQKYIEREREVII